MSAESNRLRSHLLLLRYRRGDEKAFGELVEIWKRPLFYYIRRLVDTEEDAGDVLQEVWIRVIRCLYQLRDLDRFPAWIYQIARHTALNQCRSRLQYAPLPEDEQELNTPIHNGNDEFSSADAQAIHWGLGQLPLPQREALTLFFLEDLTLEEIGSITGVSTGTVKSRLYYGRKALRDVLNREEAAS